MWGLLFVADAEKFSQCAILEQHTPHFNTSEPERVFNESHNFPQHPYSGEFHNLDMNFTSNGCEVLWAELNKSSIESHDEVGYYEYPG